MSAPHRHKFRPIAPKDDGCTTGIRRCDCGESFIQRKRRPVGADPATCTWHPIIHCRDHPDRGTKEK